MFRLAEFDAVLPELFHELALVLIGHGTERRERPCRHRRARGRNARFLRPISFLTTDHVAAQSPVSCTRAMELA